jgi:sialate O-acetylesterase
MRPKNPCFVLCLFAAAAAGFVEPVNAALPFVSPIFGDNMVLQRGKTNRLWGWTALEKEIHIKLGGRAAAGRADASGRWLVQIFPPASK